MRAKVTIFDEHTNRTVCEERIFPPYMEEFDPICRTWCYEFRVKAKVAKSYFEDLLDEQLKGDTNGVHET